MREELNTILISFGAGATSTTPVLIALGYPKFQLFLETFFSWVGLALILLIINLCNQDGRDNK